MDLRDVSCEERGGKMGGGEGGGMDVRGDGKEGMGMGRGNGEDNYVVPSLC